MRSISSSVQSLPLFVFWFGSEVKNSRATGSVLFLLEIKACLKEWFLVAPESFHCDHIESVTNVSTGVVQIRHHEKCGSSSPIPRPFPNSTMPAFSLDWGRGRVSRLQCEEKT